MRVVSTDQHGVAQQRGATISLEASDPRSRPERGLLASHLSREIVRLHANLYGRGPTRAKTYIGDDYALCVLEDVFTQAEKTLIRAGNSDHVRSTRLAFQDAVEPDFVAITEEATGRKVKAFLSQVNTGANLAVEMFLFEPENAMDAPPSAPEPGE